MLENTASLVYEKAHQAICHENYGRVLILLELP